MPAPVRTPDTAPPLIFQWKRERGVKRRLAMWLLVVAAGHAGLFYLFRVSPPLASRKPPPQQAVLYLPPNEPGARELLRVIGDRYPGAVLKSADHDLQSDLATLSKVTPAWEPVWAAHRAVLKPFPQPVVAQELPALIQPGAPVLPEEPPAPLPAYPEVKKPAPLVVADVPTDGRRIASQPAWPDKLVDDTWPISGSVPFMLGVNPSGRVEFCLPLSPATGINLEAIRLAMVDMKFETSSTGALEWINVAVRW